MRPKKADVPAIIIDGNPAVAIAEKRGRKLPGTVAFVAASIGKETFMEYARWSEDDRVRAMMQVWDESDDKARLYLNLDRLCSEIGIPGPEFVGIVAKLALEHNRDAATITYACAVPAIVQTNVEEAKKAEGFQDRKMAMEITGLLPTGKGMRIQTNILNAPGTMASSPQDIFRSAITAGADSARDEEE